MPIGLLVIAGIPTTIGVCEALSAQKKANAAAKEKAKFNLAVTVSLDGGDPVDCFCVLKDGNVSRTPGMILGLSPAVPIRDMGKLYDELTTNKCTALD
jgi:hypothetical protein